MTDQAPLVVLPYPDGQYPGCPCFTCDSSTWPAVAGLVCAIRMSLCPTCGSKRCPGAMNHADHRNRPATAAPLLTAPGWRDPGADPAHEWTRPAHQEVE